MTDIEESTATMGINPGVQPVPADPLTVEQRAAQDLALKYAEQIRSAIAGKLSGYNFYVRLHTSAEYSYVEIAAIPLGGTPIEEKAVSYSQAFYEAMVDPAVKQERAKRLFKDMKINLGLPTDD